MGLAQTGTGKTATFVLPILNRIIGSEIEQRILSTFDYGSPAPNREGRPQWIGKPQRKLSGVKKRRNNTKSLSKFLFRHNVTEYYDWKNAVSK